MVHLTSGLYQGAVVVVETGATTPRVVRGVFRIYTTSPAPAPGEPPLTGFKLTVGLRCATVPVRTRMFVVGSRVPVPQPFSSANGTSSTTS